jgi:hypothetical protein
MYSSALSWTSAVDGGGCSTPRPGVFTPEKDPVPIVQEAGWDPRPFWTGAKNLTRTGIRSPDRPARSESLYRLSYPGSWPSTWIRPCTPHSHSDVFWRELSLVHTVVTSVATQTRYEFITQYFIQIAESGVRSTGALILYISQRIMCRSFSICAVRLSYNFHWCNDIITELKFGKKKGQICLRFQNRSSLHLNYNARS